MKKIILILTIITIYQIKALAAGEFITTWDMSKLGTGTNNLSFNVETSGPVNYTWTALPSGSNGIGIFNVANGLISINGLPANNTIRLSIDSTNFNAIQAGATNDKTRLIDVNQWGKIAWNSMFRAFSSCANLNISATDIPNLNNVTTMEQMFHECTILNGPSNINSWNTSNVINMGTIFSKAINFNQPIGTWNTSSANNMIGMFNNATAFNQPIGTWNTSNVTDMRNMFGNASAFNQPIGTWNVAIVTDMSYMFSNASAFNQPIGIWNTSSVTNMSHMFQSASAFNQAIGTWNTSSVTNMSYMFESASAFNQPIGTWNTANVSNMYYTFANATNFNQNIENWNVANVTLLSSMFEKAVTFNQYLGNWQLNTGVDIGNMLWKCGMDCANYSETLQGWAANPLTPNALFLSTKRLTYGNNAIAAHNTLTNSKGWHITGDSLVNNSCYVHPNDFITTWNMSKPGSNPTQLTFDVVTTGIVSYFWTSYPSVISGSGTFTGSTATITNLPIGEIITLRIDTTNFKAISTVNTADNKRLTSIKQWGTTVWSTMNRAFEGCVNLKIYPSDLPNLSNVNDFTSMFKNCTTLNSPSNINYWDVSNVKDMTDMFANDSAFNQDISTWNTSNVINTNNMFINATSFNQNINAWDVSNISNMQSMFYNAVNFNQNLGNWQFNTAVNLSTTFYNSGLDCANYSSSLQGWDSNPLTPNGLNLGSTGLTYSTNVVANRDSLTTAKGWTIAGDLLNNGTVYVDSSVTLSGNGLSWATAYKTVQEGINNPCATQVWVKAAKYLPTLDVTGKVPINSREKTFLLRSGVSVYGGFNGTETQLSQANPAINVTTLSGDFNNNDLITGTGKTLVFANNIENAYHVVTLNNAIAATSLNGFTVSGGNTDNTGKDYLGLIGKNGCGAGVFAYNGSNFTIHNCIIKYNVASNNVGNVGGGFVEYTINYGIGTTITNSDIILNYSYKGGGGLYLAGNNLNKCIISNNHSLHSGGGAYIDNNTTIQNSSISNNFTSFSGGGLYLDGGSNSIINNVVIIDNEAYVSGGGVCNGLSVFLPASTFTNVTIVGNISGIGSGIFNDFIGSNVPMVAKFKNCIVWNNTNINRTPNSAPQFNYSNIAGLSPTGTNISTNPLFTNDANPIGADSLWFTSDDGLQLSCASPCYNLGTNTGAPTVDILGNVTYATIKDIGAYERQNNGFKTKNNSTSVCFGSSVTVGNHTYNNTGIYTDTLTTSAGCDSIVTTNLTVLPVLTATQNITLCNGQSLVVGLHTYNATGVYNDTLTTLNGCDSVVTTHLTITSSTVAQAMFTLVKDSSTAYTWAAIPTYASNVTSATWEWGDGASTTGFYPNHTYADTGLYTICLTITDSCNATDSMCISSFINRSSITGQMATINVVPQLITTVKTTSVSDNTLTIIPNPNNGDFTILTSLEGNYQIVNELGQVVKQFSIANTNSPTKLSGLSSGVYVLIGNNGNTVVHQKIIVTQQQPK